MADEDGVRDDDAQRPEGAPPAPAGPAPIIDLGADAVPVRPARALGPRRLARLQRELVERARELEERGGDPADPQLLEKQRRFAELAAQAEAANAASAGGQAAPGPAALESTAPAPETREQAAPDAEIPGSDPAEEVEQITVVFPEAGPSGGPDGHVAHEPVHVDPALFSNRLTPEELAALTHIEILAPGDAEHRGSHAHVPEPVREDPGEVVEHRPPAPLPAGEAPPAVPVPPPVPATTAQGLELLAPGEYRRRAGLPVLVTLLLAVLAALVVVLVLLVL